VRLGLAIVLWFAVFLFTIGNGRLGDSYVWARYGEDVVYVYKTVGEVVIILFFSAVYAYGTRGNKWLGAALGAGIAWVVFTVAADFILLFYDFGPQVGGSLMHYRFSGGRLWPIVLPTQMSGPLLMGLLCNVGR
jgi:hypothetical protein